jgi:hypothetical protein
MPWSLGMALRPWHAAGGHRTTVKDMYRSLRLALGTASRTESQGAHDGSYKG